MLPAIIENRQFNIGHICTRLQCERGHADKIAMSLVGPDLTSVDFTFRDLERESNRFANALYGLEISRGDVIFTFLPKSPEQFFVVLGALKAQVIVGTLFANFGPEAIVDRLSDARAVALVTKKSLLKKVLPVRNRMLNLRYIILVDGGTDEADDVLGYPSLVERSSADFLAPTTRPDTPSLLHYTSGSTGKPKGVLHLHRSVLAQSATAASVLGLSRDDTFWCTADQGWVTGTSYGIIGPWSLGVSQIHFAGAYDAKKWLGILEKRKVTVWYTAPTALRMLMREPASLFKGFDLTHLRHVFSVGEPLNPEVIQWAPSALGRTVHDTWFQTETGAIMITNRPLLPIRPGSMGKPFDGIEAAILDDEGRPQPARTVGHLCLRPGWASMFVQYLNKPEAYDSKFRHGYYWTGDTAYQDEDGYFWFMGRSDKVINTAGHLVSPFTSCL